MQSLRNTDVHPSPDSSGINLRDYAEIEFISAMISATKQYQLPDDNAVKNIVTTAKRFADEFEKQRDGKN